MKIIVFGCFRRMMLMVVLSLVVCSYSHAETGYVSDMLILSMREGPGRDYNVIATLRSNMPVEILEKQDNYFKVETPDAGVGWVEGQYITLETPKTIIIEQLEQKINDLEQEAESREPATADAGAADSAAILEYQQQVTELSASLKTALAEKKAAELEKAELAAALAALKKEIAVQPSDGADSASGETAEILLENARLKKQIKSLSEKKVPLFSSPSRTGDPLKIGMIKWFLSGAGVLVLGWFLGRTMTGRRKKSGGLLG